MPYSILIGVGFVGILLITAFCQCLESVSWLQKCLSLYGHSTLWILGMHGPLLRWLSMFCDKILGNSLGKYLGGMKFIMVIGLLTALGIWVKKFLTKMGKQSALTYLGLR